MFQAKLKKSSSTTKKALANSSGLCYHEFAEDELTKKEATRLSYKISIEAARVNAGFSQREAAKKLKICPETLSKWEKGKVGIKAADLMRLCELYKTPVEFISLP